MVSGIGNNTNYVNQVIPDYNSSYSRTVEPLNSYDIEDDAIISANAKLLNELEKFNSGNGDAVDLALQRIMSEQQVNASVIVINSKNKMMKSILELGE